MLTVLACYLVTLVGCVASVSSSSFKQYPPTTQSQNIDVYSQYENVPRENEVIGAVEYDDTGFSITCSYSDMIKTFMDETRNMGGDAFKITVVKEPDSRSTCYRGSANVLKYKKSVKKKNDALPISEKKSDKTALNKMKKSDPVVREARNPIHVAILETVSRGVIELNESLYLTNVLREEAVKVLPPSLNYTIMTRDNILSMLPPEKRLEDCEGSCLVETGRNISADYVAQAVVSTFGTSLTISVELYNSANGKLISSFNAKSSDVENLELEIRQKTPQMFHEILRLESVNK